MSEALSCPIDVSGVVGSFPSVFFFFFKNDQKAYHWFARAVGGDLPRRGPPQPALPKTGPKEGYGRQHGGCGRSRCEAPRPWGGTSSLALNITPELVVKATLTFSTHPGRSQGEVLGIGVAVYPDAG